MRTKSIIIAIALFAITCTMLAGCSDPIQDDVSNYLDNQMPSVLAMEDSITTSMNAVVGDNYVDDATLIAALKDDIIPTSNDMVAAAKAIAPETEELAALHAQFVAAKTLQNDGLVKLLAAVEAGDADKVLEANDILAEADTQINAYSTALTDFVKDYGYGVQE